jgi:peptidoglycan L-alanyl-D-glutamate endopeptidase CwlK
MILGELSRQNLVGVHPDLVRVVLRAIEITARDFQVHDGLRTIEEQTALVASGASKTMESRHLTGHAVDLVPVVNGKLRWEIVPCCAIAEAVRTAARELDVRIRWGGCWDAAFDLSTSSTEDMVSGYVERRRAQGKRALIDGPHFEIPKSVYP